VSKRIRQSWRRETLASLLYIRRDGVEDDRVATVPAEGLPWHISEIVNQVHGTNYIHVSPCAGAAGAGGGDGARGGGAGGGPGGAPQQPRSAAGRARRAGEPHPGVVAGGAGFSNVPSVLSLVSSTGFQCWPVAWAMIGTSLVAVLRHPPSALAATVVRCTHTTDDCSGRPSRVCLKQGASTGVHEVGARQSLLLDCSTGPPAVSRAAAVQILRSLALQRAMTLHVQRDSAASPRRRNRMH